MTDENKDLRIRTHLRTRLTDLIYGTVSWRDVNVPVAGEVADAVIAELKNDPAIMFMIHVCKEGCTCV